jgi:probable addiction module antidote protein
VSNADGRPTIWDSRIGSHDDALRGRAIQLENAPELTRIRYGKLRILWETQLAYLNAALAEGDAQAMVTALGTVARARGMSRVAKRCGLGRESLYKALSDSGNPAFTTIVGVASALGYTFEMRAAPAKRA